MEKGKFVEMPGRRCKLYARLFKPKAAESELKAKLLFLHGVGEHIGRYEKIFEEFADRGIAVLAFDLKGFGRSCTSDAEKSPKRGEMMHADGPKDGQESLLFDIKFFWDYLLLQVDEGVKKIPQFLMGHSMGGLLALLCGLHENNALFKDLSGIIASAPALAVAYHVPKIKLFAVNVLGSLFSTVCLDNPIDPRHISRVPDVVEAYKKDPLNHCRLSLGSAKLILGLTRKVRESAKNLKVPALYLCHGTLDQLTSCDASNEFFQSLSTENVPDKTFSSPKGFYHELHFDMGGDQIVNDYINWILERS